MTKLYRCFIDEAGDEGIGTGGSRWFLLLAVLVESSKELALSRSVDAAKSTIRQRDVSRPLHWRKFNRAHAKRIAVLKEFDSHDFHVIGVAIRKDLLLEERSNMGPHALYCGLTGTLLGRICDFLGEQGGLDARVEELCFENRTNLSYSLLESHLDRLHADSSSSVRRELFGRAVPRTKFERKNLQVADFYAGALFAALEPGFYGETDESYVGFFKKKLLNQSFHSGLLLLPEGLEAGKLLENHPWLGE